MSATRSAVLAAIRAPRLSRLLTEPWAAPSAHRQSAAAGSDLSAEAESPDDILQPPERTRVMESSVWTEDVLPSIPSTPHPSLAIAASSRK